MDTSSGYHGDSATQVLYRSPRGVWLAGSLSFFPQDPEIPPATNQEGKLARPLTVGPAPRATCFVSAVNNFDSVVLQPAASDNPNDGTSQESMCKLLIHASTVIPILWSPRVHWKKSSPSVTILRGHNRNEPGFAQTTAPLEANTKKTPFLSKTAAKRGEQSPFLRENSPKLRMSTRRPAPGPLADGCLQTPLRSFSPVFFRVSSCSLCLITEGGRIHTYKHEKDDKILSPGSLFRRGGL